MLSSYYSIQTFPRKQAAVHFAVAHSHPHAISKDSSTASDKGVVDHSQTCPLLTRGTPEPRFLSTTTHVALHGHGLKKDRLEDASQRIWPCIPPEKKGSAALGGSLLISAPAVAGRAAAAAAWWAALQDSG